MKHLNIWLNTNKISLNVEKTELVISKSPRKVLLDELKIKLSGKRLYPSNSIKYLNINMDKFLHWHDQLDRIAVKLNRDNALLLKIRNYINMKTLRNIYFVIFDSHLSYSCIVWAENISTVRRLTIYQKKAFQIMNFKDQLFHSSPLFSSKNILKIGDRTTLHNILFVCNSISRQDPSVYYDCFTFPTNLHRYETSWSVTNHLNITTFRTKNMVISSRASAIRSCNDTQGMLKLNLLLKNSTPKTIKYFLTKYLIESC